jgi:hypothetical protein
VSAVDGQRSGPAAADRVRSESTKRTDPGPFEAPAVSRDSRQEDVMREKGDVAIDEEHDAVEEALSDHHLDEVAEMIARSQADKPSSKGPERLQVMRR